MNLDFTPEEVAFRTEARTWLAENLPTEERPPDGQAMRDFDLAWQRTLYGGGWAGINWPVEYGGEGLNDIQQKNWDEEVAPAHPPVPPNKTCTLLGNNHRGPPPLPHRTHEQQA